ncbi:MULTISPECIES: hypothetical protein [Paenibacillus]|nr:MULTISPECIES: hypothetical protein [Paenibacillus]
MNKNVSYTLRAFLFIPFGVVLQGVLACHSMACCMQEQLLQLAD